MQGLRWWVLLAVGCSSKPSAPTTAPPLSSSEPTSAAPAGPLTFAACALGPDESPPTRSAPLPPAKPRPPGAFGMDGLTERDEPERGASCQAARSTLDATNALLLRTPAPPPRSTQATRWDRRSEPARWRRVAQRLGLGQAHRAVLDRNGFVVADRTFPSFVEAYHEVFQSQLPIYVSIDSVLHAVYASHDSVVGDVEDKLFAPRVGEILTAMHCWLPTGATAWPPDVARDADLYLTVARTLLAGKPVRSVLGTDARAAELVAQIDRATGIEEIELFGRRRMIDFGAYQPNGRYQGGRAHYFRAMAWLSRIELNLVSRSSRSSTSRPDPLETPREAALAVALVEAAAGAGVLDDITAVDDAWAALAGAREDVSFAALAELRARGGIQRVTLDAQPALAAQIGDRFRRSMPLHVHPDGLTDFPVIAAMFGARVSPDASALAPIVQPSVPDRVMVSASDVGFILGHDRAKHHLAGELQLFPQLEAKLPAARAALDARLSGTDLYTLWLRAIRALASEPAGTVPSFVTTPAYADLRLGSTVAAFAQLRSSYQLMSGMAYLGAGCEIPDGWVEPAPEVYDALIAYADRGKTMFAQLDPQDRPGSAAYFDRLGTTLRVLRSIVATELAGKPLTAAQKKWLSMVVEIVVDNSGSGKPPTYAGWYFDLFRDFDDATAAPELISGYAFSADHVAYAGATAPRMGVFVIDVGGAPRVAVGPIARSFEIRHPTADRRLTDDDVSAYATTKLAVKEPWAASYTVIDRATPPPIEVVDTFDGTSFGFEVKSQSDVGDVTLTLLDHHRVALQTITKRVRAGTTTFRFKTQLRGKTEMLHLVAGDFHAWGSAGPEGEYRLSYVETPDGP